jgi:DNA-binding GntR family transcriptional regulator
MSESSKKILSMLMVTGAQAPEKALGAEELAHKLGVDPWTVRSELRRLVETGYVAASGKAGAETFYLTGIGVITASSAYS